MLYSNNKINIVPIKNIENQHYTKYINIQYYYIKELVNKKEIIVKQIPRSEILVEKMIKTQFTETFYKILKRQKKRIRVIRLILL